MDKTVIDAMARWPNVPHVYGWLSLNERGQWKLHPDGGALAQPASAGEDISSPPILQFIGRNYAADDQGQWFFQNGPQRVYVRLDAAPFVLHTATAVHGGLALHTQSRLPAGPVQRWLLADDGRLYARTTLGAGLVQGRDLEAVLDLLETCDGAPLLPLLEKDTPLPADMRVLSRLADNTPHPTAFQRCPASHVEALLGFVRMPSAEKS